MAPLPKATTQALDVQIQHGVDLRRPAVRTAAVGQQNARLNNVEQLLQVRVRLVQELLHDRLQLRLLRLQQAIEDDTDGAQQRKKRVALDVQRHSNHGRPADPRMKMQQTTHHSDDRANTHLFFEN